MSVRLETASRSAGPRARPESNPAPACRWLDPAADPDWDRKLLNSGPGVSIFHTAAWAGVLQETYGYTAQYLAKPRPDRFAALLPFMEVNSWLTGRRGVSLPFTDNCEPICFAAEEGATLWPQACARAQQRGWRTIGLRGGGASLPDAVPAVSYFGHTLQLHRERDVQWEGLAPAARRGVRKAEESGVRTKVSTDLADLRTFYQLFLATRKRFGVPPPPFRFFTAIHRNVIARNLGVVILAHHAGRAVAGAVFFHFGPTLYMKFAASDQSFQHLRPNNLVMWTAARHFAGRGLTELQFGRTSVDNEGLRRFKRSWGAIESRMDYFTYHLQQQRFITSPDRAAGPLNRACRLLPDFLFRTLGSMLYRHAG